jgi:hypothetical protein
MEDKTTQTEEVLDTGASAEVSTDPQTGDTSAAVEKTETVERTTRTETEV